MVAITLIVLMMVEKRDEFGDEDNHCDYFDDCDDD